MSSKELFRKKLEGIHDSLMHRHRGTSGYSPSITGAERETVTRELLERVLPNSYRVGSGTILDARGNETGQIDAVIERPFSLSFPIGSESNRLYVADSVSAAFEIKSDLYRQGDDAKAKVAEIRRLHRFDAQPGIPVKGDALLIPCFIVAFTGHATRDSIEEKFIHPRDRYAANGVLVIESEQFYGFAPDGHWYMATGKAACILAFLSCLAETLKYMASATIDLSRYDRLIVDHDATDNE